MLLVCNTDLHAIDLDLGGDFDLNLGTGSGNEPCVFLCRRDGERELVEASWRLVLQEVELVQRAANSGTAWLHE